VFCFSPELSALLNISEAGFSVACPHAEKTNIAITIKNNTMRFDMFLLLIKVSTGQP